MSESSALRFKRVAERFGDQSVTMTAIQPTVLYALAAPSTPDDLVEEVTERAAGNTLISSGSSFVFPLKVNITDYDTRNHRGLSDVDQQLRPHQ